MMRVIVASSGLGHINRGYENWAEQLAYALNTHARKKIRVYLCKGWGKPKSNIEYVLPCIKRNSLILGGRNSSVPYTRRVDIEETIFSYPLALSAKALNVDIIHTPQLFRPLFFLKRKRGIRAEIIFANLARTLPQMSHVYVQQPAPYHIEKARKLGINTKKWFMIPLFVDTQKFNPKAKTRLREKVGIPEDAVVILSVAAIAKRYKRVDWLIKEIAKIKNHTKEKTFLVVAGQTEDETEEVITLGKKLLGDRVVFLSNLPYEKMPEVYASADLLALSSCPEFFGLAFIEAMACGKPVIGHNYPVTKWIIGNGGDIVDMTKEGELARTIERYVIDEDRRMKKGREARRRVEKFFSLDKLVKQTLHMYNVILQEN